MGNLTLSEKQTRNRAKRRFCVWTDGSDGEVSIDSHCATEVEAVSRGMALRQAGHTAVRVMTESWGVLDSANLDRLTRLGGRT